VSVLIRKRKITRRNSKPLKSDVGDSSSNVTDYGIILVPAAELPCARSDDGAGICFSLNRCRGVARPVARTWAGAGWTCDSRGRCDELLKSLVGGVPELPSRF
jgi:hypothetical protein